MADESPDEAAVSWLRYVVELAPAVDVVDPPAAAPDVAAGDAATERAEVRDVES